MNNDYIKDFNLFQGICHHQRRSLNLLSSITKRYNSTKSTIINRVRLKTSNRLPNTSRMISNMIFELKHSRSVKIEEEADTLPFTLWFFCLVIMLSQHVRMYDWMSVRMRRWFCRTWSTHLVDWISFCFGDFRYLFEF